MPFTYRFHPMAREILARVGETGFGAVNLIHGTDLQDSLPSPTPTTWRVDPVLCGPSRAFGDVGSHSCDLAERVTGDRIGSLVATTSISIPQRPAAAGGDRGQLQRCRFRRPLGGGDDRDSALILFRTVVGVAGSAVIPQGYAQCFENFVTDTYTTIRGDVPAPKGN